MAKTKPPTDAFMGMLDCAWGDFKTYTDPDEPSRPVGIAVILVGYDEHEGMTIKAGANLYPAYVKSALVQLTLGMATGSMDLEQVPGIKEKARCMTNHEFRRIRHGMMLTQKQLAEVLGYSHKIRISEYERETNPVPIPDHIADAMWKLQVTGKDRLPTPAVREWQRHAE